MQCRVYFNILVVNLALCLKQYGLRLLPLKFINLTLKKQMKVRSVDYVRKERSILYIPSDNVLTSSGMLNTFSDAKCAALQ